MSSDAARHTGNISTSVSLLASLTGVVQEGIASLPMLVAILGLILSALINLHLILSNLKSVIDIWMALRKRRNNATGQTSPVPAPATIDPK